MKIKSTTIYWMIFQSFVDIDDKNLRRLYDLQNIEQVFLSSSLAAFDVECGMKKVNIMIEMLSKPFEAMSFPQMR